MWGMAVQSKFGRTGGCPIPLLIVSAPPPSVLDPNATVSELLDGETKWWNYKLVESIFSPEEVHMIHSIPPSSTNQPDALIWRGSINRNFTLRSAYYIQMEMNKRGLATCSTDKESTNFWKQLWALKFPNNQKKFLWRASQEILPTKGNLWRRKIMDDPLCPICGLTEETTFHILWQCPAAMDVWSLGSVKIHKCSFAGPSFRQVVVGIMQKCEAEDVVLFVGLVRRIWMRMNDLVFGGLFASPQVLLQTTIRTVEEYQLAQGLRDRPLQVAEIQRQACWTAPSLGWVKANWDASLDSQKGLVECAMVVRDHLAKMVVAKCTICKGRTTPLLAEALAALMAIRLCNDMGLQQVHFEGDAKTIVEEMNHGAENQSSLGMVLEDSRKEIQTLLQWKMSFTKRKGNNTAHVLSKFATKNAREKVWVKECIRELLLLEHVALAV